MRNPIPVKQSCLFCISIQAGFLLQELNRVPFPGRFSGDLEYLVIIEPEFKVVVVWL